MGCVPCFLASPFSVQRLMLRTGLIASFSVLSGQSQASIILKVWEINAVILQREMTVIALGSYLIVGTLQLSEISVNIKSVQSMTLSLLIIKELTNSFPIFTPKNSQFLKPQNLLQLLLISICFSSEIIATI